MRGPMKCIENVLISIFFEPNSSQTISSQAGFFFWARDELGPYEPSLGSLDSAG